MSIAIINGKKHEYFEPKEKEPMTADCGHYVYKDEKIYEWEGKQICEDCLRDKLTDLPTHELASMCGVDYKTVEDD